MRLRAVALGAVAILLGAAASPALAHTGHDRRPGATKFDLEVKISRPQQPAYDPHVAADKYGNLYVVARKETPASADDRAATKVRGSSWRWTSSDGGATWVTLPAPAEADGKVAGTVSDVAVDGAGHAYVVDSGVVLRWTATGLGKVAFDSATPVAYLPTGLPPRLAAYGDGRVFLLAGSKVYASTDGAKSFGTGGYDVGSATDCRIAAGPAKAVYVTCRDSAYHVSVLVSHDDAATFTRLPLGPVGTASAYDEAPAVAVTRDGTVYVLRGDTHAKRTALTLYRSADAGRAWTQRTATDDVWFMTHLSLAAAPDGRLGAAMYISQGKGWPWFVAGGIFATGKKLLVVNFADHTPVAERDAPPPVGLTGVTFLPDSRLGVSWTVVAQTVPDGTDPLLQDAWFVRSQAPDAKSLDPNLTRTPHYEIPPCTITGQVRQANDWQAIRAPAFRSRDGGAAGDLTAYTVDPYDPKVVYVTNGTTVMRSDDGGCRWREVWSLETSPSDAMPMTAASARIVSLASPEDRREHTTVYAIVAEAGDNGGRAHVVRSPSGEPDTFVLRDSGLPPAGAPGIFRVSGANPDFLYLTAGNLLYASEDAGVSWSLRTAATDVATAPQLTALALDPKGPNNLYAVWSGTLHHSRDGARTWDAPVPSAAMQAQAGEITAVDVFHGDAELPAPTVWSAPSGSHPSVVLRSVDDGKTWATEQGTGLEGPVESAVHGSGRDVLVVSTLPVNDGHAEIYARDRTTHAYIDVSPVETTLPFHVSADRRGHPTFYGVNPSALFRYAGDAIEPPAAPDAIDDSVFSEIDPLLAPPVVSPAGVSLTLPIGAKATLPFTVDVAPRKPRIDVMFVSDTSESMDDPEDPTPNLPTLIHDLVPALDRLAQVSDLWVGVAQDKTDASPPVFRRERDLSPYGAAFAAALDRLDPHNSGGLETQLIGLDQLATGAGLDTCPTASAAGKPLSRCLSAPIGSVCEVQPDSAGCAVPPGQQANFRDGALHVVLDATDTTFRNPEGTPRKPDGTIDVPGVADKYRDAGILHVGLAMEPEGLPDLTLMSRLTGAVAPAGGLDCDGDGAADLGPGRAAVCPSAAHIDGVLMSLAHAHAVLTHLHVEPPEGTQPSRALAGVTPPEFEDLDTTQPLHLPFTVTVSCLRVPPGKYDVRLQAEVHGESATEFAVALTCAPLGAALPPPRYLAGIPLAIPPVQVAAPANPLPNLNPNAQTQMQAQVQPQVGTAAQERDQVELAAADAGDKPDDLPAAAAMLAGAAGLSAAAAYGMQQRGRTSVATARR